MKILRYKEAFDSPDKNSRKLSLQPVGREGYVWEEGDEEREDKWFLATSDGEDWVRKVEEEG